MTSFVVNMLKEKLPVTRLREIKMSLRKSMLYALIKKLGLRILKREDLLSSSEKYHVLQFGSEESIVVSQPYNNADELSRLISIRIGTFTLKKPFVSEVANAELIGPTAVGFDEDGNIISQTVVPEKRGGVELALSTRSLILKTLPSLGVPELDTVCSLVNCWGKNYFHWLVECLTRIEGSEYYQEQTGRKPVLIIDSNPPNWKIESLRLLGYELDDCISWNKSRIKVKRLVVPSFRREEYQISPTACRWLSQRIISNLPDVGTENLSFSSKIYISRSKAAGRRVINEDDVLKALTPFGFVAYTLENMSFSDQVRLFSQAEIVVAPHGAGLANIIFSQNLILIELFSSWVVPVYFTLAKALGFHYGCLQSASSSLDSNETLQYSEQFKDIIVDIVKLRDLVAEMQELSVAK
jgi:hypothetical protein